MHILVTADTVGGVWSYTRELVSGLAARGVRVTLVSFGGVPRRDQRAWLAALPEVEYYPTAFRLEWMEECTKDLVDSAAYLLRIIAESKPDLLHLSQFCYGALTTDLPKVVVAHSDVFTWHEVVRGRAPYGEWAHWYRHTVQSGLDGASVVVAPSRWMAARFRQCYEVPVVRVIYNGRSPLLFDAFQRKQEFAASAGRLWDEGKQTFMLRSLGCAMPIYVAGSMSLSGADEMGRDDELDGVVLCGELGEAQMSELLGRAAIYVATSKYEPFGLSPLEAALSRCALVLNDIPSLREIWCDAAMYFRRDDAASLRDVLDGLHSALRIRLEYGERAYRHALANYSADAMVEEYLQMYSTLLERQASAA
jgi:glycosyltransferase involved in cell wall biosynthesis